METQEFYQKISNVQHLIGAIPKDSTNPHYKSSYFDINAIIGKLRNLLKIEGLVLTQPISDGKLYSIITEIKTGKTIESFLSLPELENPQKLGSCITYFRRFTLQSLLALEAEDDDGNFASQETSNFIVDDNIPWLDIYVKGTTDLTQEMIQVSEKMKMGAYKSIRDIRKNWKVNKVNAALLESWFVKLKSA